jgi:L-aminopeptidase/D-esterase-like protein
VFDAITDVAGISVGHWTDRVSATGCTVLLCPDGAVGGVDVRGAAPGTRETDLLRPGNLVDQVHAVLLSGGSAFGLDAASGVMNYLEENGIGFGAGPVRIPIVPAAILFDLGLVNHKVRPGSNEGYQACVAASSLDFEQGSVGAGTGATVGKALGMLRATKGGLGSASVALDGGLIVGALVAVNAIGDVVDPDNGEILAGPRKSGGGFYQSTDLLMASDTDHVVTMPTNTTIGVIATNASLTKEQVCRLAQVGHDGMALAIRPCHTIADGDVLFALSTGGVAGEIGWKDFNKLGIAATRAVSMAIVKAVKLASGIGDVPALREIEGFTP